MTPLSDIEAAARAATIPHGGLYESQLRTIPMGVYQDATPPETILALCADLRACVTALKRISTGECVCDGVFSDAEATKALQNLKKWGL